MTYIFSNSEVDYKIQVLEKPRFIEVDDKTGPIVRYQIKTVHISMDEETIVVEYVPLIMDIAREIRSVGDITPFTATSQENWAYFYLPSRNGEQLEKMVINGLSLRLLNFTVFNPNTGEFEPPVEMAPVEEPVI